MKRTFAACIVAALLGSGCAGLLGPSKVCNPRRTSTGAIARSESAVRAFMRMTGYPNGRPGYVVDHIVPLACCGADDPSNMQWQTAAAAKAKDAVELKGCGR